MRKADLRLTFQEITQLQLNISNKLRQQLAHLTEPQLEHIVKQAEHLRARSGTRSGSLDEWIQRALKKERRSAERATGLTQGTIASVMARDALVEVSPSHHVKCACGTHQVVVGDEVSLGYIDGTPTLVSLLPRRTKLARADVKSGGEQLVAANVDSVVIVVSVVSPPLHPRIIDRYLVAIRAGGIQPIVCVNKVDLLCDIAELEPLEAYQRAGLPIFKCSAADGYGTPDLRYHLAGQTVAFVGHSGVGKSSLINAFAPELNLETGAVSAGYGRGTHTTTTSSLHRLPDGTTIIDTPGIRSFGLFDADSRDIAASFPEFQGHRCRFNDCQHVSEPDCGVWSAVESGVIAAERYWTYRKLLEGG